MPVIKHSRNTINKNIIKIISSGTIFKTNLVYIFCVSKINCLKERRAPRFIQSVKLMHSIVSQLSQYSECSSQKIACIPFFVPTQILSLHSLPQTIQLLSMKDKWNKSLLTFSKLSLR